MVEPLLRYRVRDLERDHWNIANSVPSRSRPRPLECDCPPITAVGD
jgi:hypothetical protein